ncbi:hypothetical protein Cgig2_030439 [Carnegiea gigantea]|uniref:Sec20 C-terminal domain-containing protein n=1 Tax=Carnegiea gigantea TaxID=171969 RepID=A0A9Q1QLK3_9CARY|nr:hypothetical protein Cgig2_030439 [Carnegiea gigantea]
MDRVVEAVEEVKKQWDETWTQTRGHIKAIEDFGKSRETSGEKNSLPRLNGLAQEGLNMLNSLVLKLDLLAPQLPSYDDVESAQALLQNWRQQCQRPLAILSLLQCSLIYPFGADNTVFILFDSLRVALRTANLQAKANVRKTAQEEHLVSNHLGFAKRELLLGGGSESTMRRRNLQTKAGMTSAAESITESLRRTRQIMVQEVERSANTLMVFEESTGVLKKAEKEYKGHHSLLMRTRNLLSTMPPVLYVVSKRIGSLKLQRAVTSAIKAGVAKGVRGGQPPVADAIDRVNGLQHDNVPPTLGGNPGGHARHDEL